MRSPFLTSKSVNMHATAIGSTHCVVDADDTVFDFQKGNRAAVGQLMEELGLASPTVFEEYQAVNHACWQALERGEMNQETLHVERFRRFLGMKGLDEDPGRVADRFAELLGAQTFEMPYAYEMMEELSRIANIVILTNGITRIQKSRMARSRLSRFVDRVVISQEVGVAKPDPRIFEMALDGADKRDALMIGDGIGSDVLGANRAGIDMCWYNPKGLTLPEGLHAEYIVDDLRQIPDIVAERMRGR